ncbi:MAG: hypothetical protein M1833_002860 [Piccolia ochrophora]|nr:MAG: hypothetical protein M1833_002860 [Piccolia ochrophora]
MQPLTHEVLSRYQIYDSVQAFTSSIAGLLSSRAVLQGFGVGDSNASPTTALLLSVFQESMGRIATIVFAHKLGTSLEPECKMYRLAADVFNDTSILLDCFSPILPKPARVVLLSCSSVLRALCGVAAGSSKASLSAHFAKWGNLGELNAKDASQETIISLLGMLAGSVVVSHVTSNSATWSWLILLLSIHLGTNLAAIKAVSMHTLNRQRANIVLSNLIDHGRVMTPEQVSKEERIFERDGVLRWKGSAKMGHAHIGVELQDLLSSLTVYQDHDSGIQQPRIALSDLVELYKHERYILFHDSRRREAYIVLKEGASAASQLQAWMHALLVAARSDQLVSSSAKPQKTAVDPLTSLREALKVVRADFEDYVQQLRAAGWDVDVSALETSRGFRVSLQEH